MRSIDALLLGLLFLVLAGGMLMPALAYLGRKIMLLCIALAGTLFAVLRDEFVKWLLDAAGVAIRKAELLG